MVLFLFIIMVSANDLLNKSKKYFPNPKFNAIYLKKVENEDAITFNMALERAENKLAQILGKYDWHYAGIVQKWTLEFIPIIKKEIAMQKKRSLVQKKKAKRG